MKVITMLFLLVFCAAGAMCQNTPQVLTGNAGNINTVQFSPDGKVLLSGCQDGTIRVWNTADHFSLSKELKIGSASIKSISFSAKGDEFTVSTYAAIMIYQYPSLKKKCVQKHAHTTFVESAVFSNDGKHVVSTSWRDNCISLWDAGKLHKERDFSEATWTRPAIFLPDRNLIASGNHENNIRIWNVSNGSVERTLAGHTDWVECLFITKDGKYLVSGSLDKTIRIWDVASGKLFKTLTSHEGGVNALALSEDGKYFASSSLDKTIKIWNTATFTEISSLNNQENVVLCLAFSPDNKYLASAGMDKKIKIWSVDTMIK